MCFPCTQRQATTKHAGAGLAGPCPPEDCGGVSGYYDLLAALADPKHEQHEEMKEWVGGAWDATRFSLEHTNAGLKRIKA